MKNKSANSQATVQNVRQASAGGRPCRFPRLMPRQPGEHRRRRSCLSERRPPAAVSIMPLVWRNMRPCAPVVRPDFCIIFRPGFHANIISQKNAKIRPFFLKIPLYCPFLPLFSQTSAHFFPARPRFRHRFGRARKKSRAPTDWTKFNFVQIF